MAGKDAKSGLDLSGDEKPEPEKPAKPSSTRGRGRPSTATKTRDLKTRVSETIGETAEWLDKAGDEELAEILRDDGPKMAAWLAYHAEKRARLAKVLARVFGEGSALDFGRAFGRLLRALQTRIGQSLPRPGGGEGEEGPEPQPDAPERFGGDE